MGFVYTLADAIPRGRLRARLWLLFIRLRLRFSAVASGRGLTPLLVFACHLVCRTDAGGEFRLGLPSVPCCVAARYHGSELRRKEKDVTRRVPSGDPGKPH